MLIIPIIGHGRGGRHTDAAITVEIIEDHILLVIESEPGETIDDHDIDRSLYADEAREVAAALLHFADRLEA